MTDKQIIIDGVDVSECSWHTQGATGMICADWHLSNDCRKNLNCYYKQLKLAEAQCEAMFVSHTDLEKKLKAKEQECEELKAERDSYIDKYFLESQRVLSLRKVLKDIKNILLFNKKELDECLYNDIDGQILQKISEVEE